MANPHDLHAFVIESVRKDDPSGILERWFGGLQEQFDFLYGVIEDLQLLLNPEECPEGALAYLRSTVGFGPDLDWVVSTATTPELRKLITVAAAAWKFKASKRGIRSVLQAMTGAPVRVLNWFYHRLLVTEWELGREDLGFDPWLTLDSGFLPFVAPTAVVVDSDRLRFDLTSLLGASKLEGVDVYGAHITGETIQWGKSVWVPSLGFNALYTNHLGQTVPSTTAGDYYVGLDPPEFTSDIRVVDSASINHTLIENLATTHRGCGERFLVSYMLLQDNFLSSMAWAIDGTVTHDQDLGVVSLGGDSAVLWEGTGASAWADYHAEARVSIDEHAQACGIYLSFYYTDPDNFYRIQVTYDTGLLYFTTLRVVAGVPNVFSITQLHAFHPGVYYTLQVSIKVNSSGDNVIHVSIDENVLTVVSDASHATGSITVGTLGAISAKLKYAEAFNIPMEHSRLGPLPPF